MRYLSLEKTSFSFPCSKHEILNERSFVVLPDYSSKLLSSEVFGVKEEGHSPVDLLRWGSSTAFDELELVGTEIYAFPHA